MDFLGPEKTLLIGVVSDPIYKRPPYNRLSSSMIMHSFHVHHHGKDETMCYFTLFTPPEYNILQLVILGPTLYHVRKLSDAW